MDSPFSRSYWKKIRNNLIDDENRNQIFIFWLPLLLFVISFTMSLFNLAVHNLILRRMTFWFSIVNLIIFFLNFVLNKRIIKYMTMVAFFVMVIYFLITGGTEGFSTIWILLAPSFGFLVYGKRKGFILNTIILAICIFFLLTPWGRDLVQYPQTKAFRQRFPLSFCGFALFGFIVEYIREATNTKLIQLREKYYYSSTHDSLTGILNRTGIQIFTEKNKNFKGGFIAVDIDNFKLINDKYGHLIGDQVLKTIATSIKKCCGEFSIRWGGDEFWALLPECKSQKELEKVIKKLILSIRNIEFKVEDSNLSLSISAGALFIKTPTPFDIVAAKADKSIYKAKSKGKNQYQID